MADNTTLNAGSGGDTIRTDDDGTAKWQVVKTAFGADGTFDMVGESNPLPASAADRTDSIYNSGTAVTPVYVSVSVASSGDNTLVAAAGASNKIRVLSAMLVAADAVTVAFEDGASGTPLTGDMSLVAGSGFVLPYSKIGWFETTANTLLNLELSAAVQVSGCIVYAVVQ